MALKQTLAGWIVAALAVQAHAQAGAPARAVDLPPPADLAYEVKAHLKGFTLSGESQVSWRSGEGRYTIVASTRASLVGKLIENRSEGSIDAFGIAPDVFTEKRIRKPGFTTTFNRGAQSITFSESGVRHPIKGGEQDRASVQWQLAALARANPDKFVPGSEWRFVVAGRRDADTWKFRVVSKQTIHTGMGELSTVHLRKLPVPKAGEQTVDLWLAPSLGWYPVQLRLTEDNGEYVEQTLQKLTKR